MEPFPSSSGAGCRVARVVFISVCAAIAAVCVSPRRVSAFRLDTSPQYAVVDMGPYGDDRNSTTLNNQPQVLTSTRAADGPQEWTPAAGWQSLGHPDRAVTYPRFSPDQAPIWQTGTTVAEQISINNGGTVVGTFSDFLQIVPGASAGPQAFLRDSSGTWTNLLTQGFPGWLSGTGSYAFAVNDPGQVLGTVQNTDGTSSLFLWQNGAVTATIPASVDMNASLNNHGEVAIGNYDTSQVSLWLPQPDYGLPAGLTPVGDLGQYSLLNGMNDSAQIVGESVNQAGEGRAYLWTPGGTDGVSGNLQMKDLGLFGGDEAEAAWINNNGQLVGTSWDNVAGTAAGIIWDAQQGARRLTDLIAADAGFDVQSGWKINDVGEIIALAARQDTGELHALLLRPVSSAPAQTSTEPVTVTPPVSTDPTTNPTISLTFPNVTAIAPDAAVTVTPTSTPPDTPAIYAVVGNSSYEIQNAGISFSGQVLVSFSYDPLLVTDPSKLQILHKDPNLGWVPLPGLTVNTDSHLVSAYTSSFSPFAVAQQVPDTTPPVVTVPADIAAAATSTGGAVVSFTASAVDDVDGPVPVTYSQNPGTLFPLGTTTVTVSARDAAGNAASASFLVTVTYFWSGTLPPINWAPLSGNPNVSVFTSGTSSVFKLGSTVPVKFQLTGASAPIKGGLVGSAYLNPQLVTTNLTAPVNETTITEDADQGSAFRYDSTANQYIYNWSTKGLSSGVYRLYLNLGDGVTRFVDVGLR
jgi:hypothetical protein